MVQRHIEESRLGDRRRELAINAAVRGQNAVALAGFIAGLRIQRSNLHLGPIADGGFARHQQLVTAAVAGDIDVVEGFADKVQVAFQRQRADIAVAGRDMAAGLDLGLAQRAVAAQRAAGLDRGGAAVALPVIDVGARRRVEDQRAAVLGAESLDLEDIVFFLGIDVAGDDELAAARGDVGLQLSEIAVQRGVPGGVDHLAFAAHLVAENVIAVGMVKVHIAAEQSAPQGDRRLGIDGSSSARRAERRLGQSGAGIHVAAAADNQRAAVRAGAGLAQHHFVGAGGECPAVHDRQHAVAVIADVDAAAAGKARAVAGDHQLGGFTRAGDARHLNITDVDHAAVQHIQIAVKRERAANVPLGIGPRDRGFRAQRIGLVRPAAITDARVKGGVQHRAVFNRQRGSRP